MNPETLLQRPAPTQKLTLGCPVLDRCLSSGIPCKTLTEISSESGAGKTQLCLQLSLTSQLPLSHGGLSGATIFLYTEFPFPSRRLHQLSQSFASKHAHLFGFQYNPCDNVFVQGVHNADQLFDVMSRIEGFISSRRGCMPVRLVVVDSIAAVFRSEFEFTGGDLKRRSGLFFKVSGKLRELARRFDLAVVVTNQVVDLVGNEGVNGLRIGNLRELWSNGRRVAPALGLAWSNCVNSRLFLLRDEVVGVLNGEVHGGGESELVVQETRRRLHVVFAPHLPASSCEFVIRQDGVFGVDR